MGGSSADTLGLVGYGGRTPEGEQGQAPRMELRLRRAETLKHVVDIARHICQDVNLRCNPRGGEPHQSGGISVQSMDGRHRALFTLKLDTRLFDEYRCDKPLVLGVNVELLSRILRISNSEQILELEASGDGDHLLMRFAERSAEDDLSERGSSGGSSSVVTCSLKLMDLDTEFLELPEQDYQAELSLPARDFGRSCSQLKEFGDFVRIAAYDDFFELSSASDVSKARLRFPATSHQGSRSPYLVKISQPCSGRFSMEPFASFGQSLGHRGIVRLRLAEGAALMVEYSDWGGGTVVLHLAPTAE